MRNYQSNQQSNSNQYFNNPEGFTSDQLGEAQLESDLNFIDHDNLQNQQISCSYLDSKESKDKINQDGHKHT